MPKKLAQLAKDVDLVTTAYDDKMGRLKGILTTASNHRGMIQEGEEVLLHQIEVLEGRGTNGATVGAFYDHPGVKKLVDQLEIQNAGFVKACTNYWQTRDGLDRDLKSAKDVLASAKEIVAEKKKQWFGSKSLPEIETAAAEFEKWCGDSSNTARDLDKVPKPQRLGWAAPGSVKNRKRETLQRRQDLFEWKTLMEFVEKRILDDSRRAQTHQRIHDRLAKLAQNNPGA